MNRLKEERKIRQGKPGEDDTVEEDHALSMRQSAEPLKVTLNAGTVPVPVGQVRNSAAEAADLPALAPGQLLVTYQGHRACVRWSVDFRRLGPTSARNSVCKRFSFALGSDQVPFMFLLQPADDQDLWFHLQVKCADATALAAAAARLSVVIGVEGLGTVLAAEAHNFAEEAICSLPSKEGAWKLPTGAVHTLQLQMERRFPR